MVPARILYTANAHATGGPDGGCARTLEVKLSLQRACGSGTNAERLFAPGWSAWFVSAMRVAAVYTESMLSSNAAVDIEGDLGTRGHVEVLIRCQKFLV